MPLLHSPCSDASKSDTDTAGANDVAPGAGAVDNSGLKKRIVNETDTMRLLILSLIFITSSHLWPVAPFEILKTNGLAS